MSIGVNISRPKTRKYVENSVDLIAGVMRYAIIIPGNIDGQFDWSSLT